MSAEMQRLMIDQFTKVKAERDYLREVVRAAHWAFVVELGATGPASQALAQAVAKMKE